MFSVSKKRMSLQAVLAESNDGEVQTHLRELAHDLAAEITAASPDRGDELLSKLIAELAMSAADQRRQKERHQRQAEGIAAAKARGVQFGRRTAELPENFEKSYHAWRDGELSLRQAAKACGMVTTTFQAAALRKEQSYTVS